MKRNEDETLAGAKRLRQARKRADLTAKQAAEAAGVTIRTYLNFEAGTSTPRMPEGCRLAAALGVTPDELWGDPAARKRRPSGEWSPQERAAMLSLARAIRGRGVQ